MLVTVSLAWVVLQTGRFLLSPLLPAIIKELQITEATTSITLALFQSAYVITQYPGGECFGRWAWATLIIPELSILILDFLTFSLAGGLAGFVVATVITGLGKRLFAIPSRTLLSDLFVERRGRALGLYAVGTDLGDLVSSGLAILALTYVMRRTSFLPVTVVPAGLAVLYALRSRNGCAVESPKLHASETLRRLPASAEQRRTLLVFGLFYFMVDGSIDFFPTYLVEARGFDQRLAGATLAIVLAIGITIKPVAGDLSGQFRRGPIVVVGTFVTAGTLAVLSAAETRLLICVSVVALATGYKTEFPLADAIIMGNVPDADRETGLGATRALFLDANTLGPAYISIVATYASYIATFAGLAVCPVISAGLLYWDACEW